MPRMSVIRLIPGTICHSSGVGCSYFLFRYNICTNLSQHNCHLNREYCHGILGATPRCSSQAGGHLTKIFKLEYRRTYQKKNCIRIPEESLSDKSTAQWGTSGVVELDQNLKDSPFHSFVGRAHAHERRGSNLAGCTGTSKQLEVHVQPGHTEFIDRRHRPCYNIKTKLKSRGN